MTVRIPIEATATSVTDAFDQIRAAIRRAGQEGRDFAKLDLSHPELRRLAEDIRKIQQNFRTLGTSGYGRTAAAVRRGSYLDPLDWYGRHGNAFPDESDRLRHRSNAGRYMLQGTQYQLPGPRTLRPPVGGGGGAAAAEEGAAGGMGGMAGSAMRGFGVFMLAAAGLSKISDMAKRGVEQATQEATATDTLMRHIRDTAVDFDGLRTSVRDAAKGLQLTYVESQRLSLTWTKLTNDADPTTGMRTAVGFARSFGMDPDAATQSIARGKYLGEDPRRFALLIAEGVKEGGQTGQATEVMQALLRWSETASRALVTRTNSDSFMAMFAGMNATGLPGLKGAAAENIISTMNAATQNGGNMGEASRVLFYNAMARHGVTDPFDQKYLRDGGLFDTAKGALGYGDNTTTYDAVREEIERIYKGMPDRRKWEAFGNVFGLNSRQAEKMYILRPTDVHRASDYLVAHHIDQATMDPTAIGDIVDVVGASPDKLNAMRTRLLARTGSGSLSDAERASLQGASGGGLEEMLVRLISTHGMEQDQGTRDRQSMSDSINALTKAATGLLPIITDMREGTAALVGAVGELTEATGHLYEVLVHGKDNPGARTPSDLPPNDPAYVAPSAPLVNPGWGDTGTNPGGSLLPGGTGDTRGFRNNNPTNLEFRPGQGALRSDGRFGVFPTMDAGVQADLHQYRLYQSRGMKNARSMILTATPRSENPGVDGYIARVARRMGVSPDAPLDLDDPNVAARWIAAISQEENDGRVPDPAAVRLGSRRELGMTTGGPQTPLPAAASGAGPAGAPNFRIGDLKVVHETPDGTPLGVEHLPVTQVQQPQAW